MIERRPFGWTGHQSSVTLFGGAALARASQADAGRCFDCLPSDTEMAATPESTRMASLFGLPA